MVESHGEPPEVSILLLGDADVGKSTFLSRLTAGANSNALTPLRGLKDMEQPFVFDIRFSKRNIRLEFYDTSSPSSYFLLKPSMIILCFSIPDRQSLTSVHERWKHIVETHFNYDESLPIILLGLKRDLRKEGHPEIVFPHEAVGIAQQMRCDRYCECSAVTGELCKEVFEDIVKTAAMTTTEEGGKTAPPPCSVM